MIQKLGKYTIIEKLGEGSMGAVYKAYHDILDRYVAIKTMAEDIKWEPELKLRFYREARSAASLRHPNIVTIHDLGEEGKITYIVMELLEGKDLKGIIRDKDPMPLERKLSILIQVADGLNHAHLHGIIHRDIKPGNIHVTPDGNVKILDFGIARVPSSDLTRSGVRLGTPVYMSPEQIRGGDYDERSDIFSAGIVFYELLTYQHPFRDKNLVKTMDNILFLTSLPFQEQFPNAPAGLYPIIAKCLEKEPNKRFSSMGDVGRACRQLQEQLISTALRLTEDLQAGMIRLREACEKPGASPRLHELFRHAKSLLSKQETPDFLSLQELTAAFTQESILPLPKISSSQAQVARESKAQEYGERTQGQAERERSAKEQASQSEADQVRGREMFLKGEALMREDKPEDALDYLRQAMGLLGPKNELVQMLTDARKRIEDKKKAHLEQLFETGRGAVAAGEFAKAIDALDGILQQDPDYPEAVEMRRRAVGELEAQKASLARREDGEKERALGFRLIAEKKFREGLRTLKHAGELLGEDEAINLGIAEAEREIRADEIRARVQLEISEGTQLFRSDALDKARLRAVRALELAPKNPEATDLLARIDKAIEDKRRKDRVNELYAKIQEAVGRKAFDEALTAAYRAVEIDPGDSRIPALIDQIEQAKERTRKEETVALLLSNANDSLGAQLFDDAITRAESALAIVPGHPEALRCIETAREKKEAKRRQDEIAGLIASAQQAFLRGDLTRCETDANRLVQIDPQGKKGKELLQMVEQARQKAMREKLLALSQQGRMAMAAGDLAGAENFARSALDLDPQNPEAMRLITEIEAARDEARRRALRERIAGIIAQGRSDLASGDFAGAEKNAGEALGLDPKDVQANLFQKEIEQAKEQARLKALAASVSQVLVQARASLDEGDLDVAEKRAKEALDLDATNAGAKTFMAEVEQAREEVRIKARKEKIAGLVSQGLGVLNSGDFSGAERFARQALDLDAQNPEAQKLLADVAEARRKALTEKISGILSAGRKALAEGDFSTATRHAREVLDLEGSNPDAKALLDDIEKARQKILREKIAAILTQGRTALAAGDFLAASKSARDILDLDVQNADGKSLLVDIEQAKQKALRDRISSLLSQGQKALQNSDFRGAAKYAQDVLNIDAQNAGARNLAAEAARAEEGAKQAEIASLLKQSRDFVGRKLFDEASGLANKALGLDAKNKDAKSLLKEIEKAKKSHEKELKKKQKKVTEQKIASRSGADLDDTAPMARLPRAGETKGLGMKWILVGVGVIILIGAGLGGYLVWKGRQQHQVVVSVADQLAAAQSSFDQKRYDRTIEITGAILASDPENAQAKLLHDSAQLENKKLQISNLMIEAQTLKAQNQLEDAKRVLQKILELMPAYEPALTVLAEVEATLSSAKGAEEQDALVKQWLDNAASMLESGKLVEAKAELDKAARLRAADPQLAKLLRIYRDKNSEIARKQKEQTDIAVKQNRTGDLMKNAEELFRQGRYAESDAAAAQVLALAPQNSQVVALRGQIADATRQVKLYEAAISGKAYDDAIAAVVRLEKINSTDPNIAEWRRRAESSKAAAKAQFSILRLSEPATLLLDDKPVDSPDGEIENKVIQTGKHVLAVKGRIQQTSRSVEFSDGQNLTFVYNTDASPPEFRPWVPADKDLISRRKEREELHPFSVEHSHGFLKGRCNGTLTISGLRVEYKGSDSDHNFVLPFRQLKLSVEKDKLDLTDSKGGGKYSFKAADAKAARDIQQLWSKLSR